MSEFTEEIAKEIREAKAERDENLALINSAKDSFAEEVKNAFGNDMKAILGASEEKTEKKKSGFSKFLDKLARVCQ